MGEPPCRTIIHSPEASKIFRAVIYPHSKLCGFTTTFTPQAADEKFDENRRHSSHKQSLWVFCQVFYKKIFSDGRTVAVFFRVSFEVEKYFFESQFSETFCYEFSFLDYFWRIDI
jgi:hypothetical protein